MDFTEVTSYFLLPLLPWTQQVPRNDFRKFPNISRRDAEDGCGIARVSSRPVERSRPQPFQKRYFRVGEERDLYIGQYEVLLLIERVDSPSGVLRFSA